MNAAMPLKKIPVIKLVLLIRNRSVQELATHVGVARPYVSTWVNGHDEPSRDQAEKIAEFLGWPIDEIWEDEAPALKKKRGSKEKIGPAKLVDEGALKLGEAADAKPGLYALPKAPDYTLAEANGLFVVEDIDEAGDRAVAIPIWPESVAATALASNDAAHDQVHAWVPATLRRIHGAKLRAVEVAGRSMVGAGIEPGDIIFVRCSSDPKKADGKIVIVNQDGGMTLKRLHGDVLEAESDRSYPRIQLGEDAHMQGVVVGIHKPKK